MYWFIEALKKYAVFQGRARRKEYWMFYLMSIIIAVIIGALEGMFRLPGLIGKIYPYTMALPTISVSVRRLHDTNRSGWWFLINLIPVIGSIFFLLFTIEDSTPGENKYGPNPKEEGMGIANIIPPNMKKCPECAELVKKEARICPHCNHEFFQIPKTIEEEIEEFEKRQEKNSPNNLYDDEII
jgi:uncharacterized membrane protein YhaH (DUF805 family)